MCVKKKENSSINLSYENSSYEELRNEIDFLKGEIADLRGILNQLKEQLKENDNNTIVPNNLSNETTNIEIPKKKSFFIK